RSVFNLEDVLGKYFNGTIICDCYAAYFAFIKNLTNAMLSLCWAHLLREYIFCYDCLSAEVHRYGEKCILILKELFVEYRAYMEILDKTSPKAEEIFARLLELKKKITEATLDAPPDSKKPNLLAKRFQEHGEYYFTFLFNLDVTPTNNAAERLIRSIVIDRKISYGVQSNLGSYFCETIWTVIENLDLKGISPREFLTDALKRYKSGEPLPSIINIGETVPQKYIDEAKEERERILIDRKIETTKQKAARKAAPKTVAKATETDDMASKSDSGNQNNVEKKAMDENPAASDIVTNSPEIATKTPLKADQKPMDESPSASDLNTANGMKYPKAIPKKPPGTDHKAMDENPLFVPTREKPLVASPMVANDPGNEKPLETKSTGYARNTPNPRPETVGANPKRPDPTPGQTNPQPSSNGVEPREPQQEWRGPKLSKAIRQKLLELTYCHRPSKAPEQTESSGACPPGPHRRKVASEVSPV
ncbi:MAG: transposase, partial [Deltaproteobacteria bacterium]|nr:transposase [Deltaproteobacteria bacterium]